MEENFWDVNLDDAVTPKVLPEGTEAELKVTEVTFDANKYYILVVLKPQNIEGFVRSVRHFLYFPKKEDDAEKRNNKLVSLKKFAECFDVPWPPNRPDDLTGHTGWVILTEKEDDRGPLFGNINEIKQMLARR